VGVVIDARTVTVPEPAAGDPDLPALMTRALVFMEANAPEAPHAGGMPRSMRDVLGRVLEARWEGDREVTVRVRWASESVRTSMRELLGRNLAGLRWDPVSRCVLAHPMAAQPS
jgi:hypothetical protein